MCVKASIIDLEKKLSSFWLYKYMCYRLELFLYHIILNSASKGLILFRHRRQQTKITKHDLSEYRAPCTRLNERYRLSREIFTKAYSEMILIPISDINLDARGILIYSTAMWLFYRWLQEGEREFLSTAEPMDPYGPLVRALIMV